MSILFFFSAKDICQLLDRLCRIDNTTWIIGGIDNDSLGLWAQQLLKCIKINLKALCISRIDQQFCLCIFYPYSVLWEKWSKGDKFIARVRHRIDTDAQGSCCSNGHVKICTCKMCAKPTVY